MQDSRPQLVAQARRGSRSAFVRLVQLHERTVLAVAYGVLCDAAEAADVTQEAFLRAWQRLGELQSPDRFGPWVARIARNLAADHLRRSPRETAVEHPPDGDGRLVVDPAAEVDRRELRRAISSALAELDELTRSAVVLRYYQDLSSKQIGELLDLSAAAVDMRLSRARALLREKLAPMATTR